VNNSTKDAAQLRTADAGTCCPTDWRNSLYTANTFAVRPIFTSSLFAHKPLIEARPGVRFRIKHSRPIRLRKNKIRQPSARTTSQVWKFSKMDKKSIYGLPADQVELNHLVTGTLNGYARRIAPVHFVICFVPMNTFSARAFSRDKSQIRVG